MKRLIAASLIMTTLISTSVFADIDLSGYSDEEVAAILYQVEEEVAARKIEKSAKLVKGSYYVGRDIPPGSYVIEKQPGDDSGIIYCRAADDEENNYPSILYEFVGKQDTASFFVSLGEGDELYTPFDITLTVSAGVKFE